MGSGLRGSNVAEYISMIGRKYPVLILSDYYNRSD